MNRANQFFDKFLKSFDKVSDNEKKRIFERLSDLCYSQNTIIENLEEGIISIDINNSRDKQKSMFFVFNSKKL